MERKKNLRKAIVVLVACLILTLAFSVPTSAREIVELERACTLDLTYKYEETFFDGEEIKIYKVADFTLVGEYVLSDMFDEYPINIGDIKTQDEWNAVRDTIVAYIAADSLVPTTTATTNADGVASFDNLSVGLYLVGGIVTDYIDDGTIEFADFLISVPGIDEADKWVYDVDATPKSVYHEPVYEEIEYSVIKLWKDSGNEDKRPNAVEIEIFKDGELIENVKLSSENNWKHSWIGLDDGSVWTVVERNVPEGYTLTLEKKDAAFVVTNTFIPIEPPTGDSFNAQPYIIAICVSGVLLIVVGIIRHKKESESV